MNNTLNAITIDPKKNPPFATVIWLHGLGASPHDFVPIVPDLQLDETPLRFVFPQAPLIPVTINGGITMPAWFDMTNIHPEALANEAQIATVEQGLHHLMEKEINQGLPASHIILAGFSQGGAVALYTGLRYKKSLGGLIGLSTFLPVHDMEKIATHPMQQKTPIFMAHGTKDPLVSFDWGENTANTLKSLHYPLTWHSYPVEHTVPTEAILDLKMWLKAVCQAMP